jgi:hypothetical protein
MEDGRRGHLRTIEREGLAALLMVVDDDGGLTMTQAQALFGHPAAG